MLGTGGASPTEFGHCHCHAGGSPSLSQVLCWSTLVSFYSGLLMETAKWNTLHWSYALPIASDRSALNACGHPSSCCWCLKSKPWEWWVGLPLHLLPWKVLQPSKLRPSAWVYVHVFWSDLFQCCHSDSAVKLYSLSCSGMWRFPSCVKEHIFSIPVGCNDQGSLSS